MYIQYTRIRDRRALYGVSRMYHSNPTKKIDRFIQDWPVLSSKEPADANLTNYKGIIAIGSGTSYNAVKVIEPLIRSKLGLKFETLKPADFFYYLHSTTLIKNFYISLSPKVGGSKLVYECLKVVNDFGCDTVALSEDGESIIASESKLWIDMRSDFEPFLFRTIGYDMSAVVSAFLPCGYQVNAQNLDQNGCQTSRVPNKNAGSVRV